jgi:hypothetical protein
MMICQLHVFKIINLTVYKKDEFECLWAIYGCYAGIYQEDLKMAADKSVRMAGLRTEILCQDFVILD